jgi:hypothetical protein
VEQHVIDALRRDDAFAFDGQQRRDGGGDESGRRLEHLQLEAVRIRPHADRPWRRRL